MSYDPLAAFRLDGRVAIVTGASSGLGAGFAKALAADGAKVVVAARRLDRLEEVAAAIRKDGGQAIAVACDVAVPEDCAGPIEAAMQEFGAVDVLVNNAGLGPAVPASRETPDSFRAVIEVNLNGTFWMSQAAAAVMRPGSSIVNVASMLGQVTSRFPRASYSSSKAGVIGLTRDLAQQWSGRKGIRVNALCPGYVVTEMNAEHAEQIASINTPGTMLGRFGEQHEMDAALIFLASPASSYVTGTILTVDGGYTAL
ncbi:MAG: SDR family NAD(P)-dependent oxidoreductase [Sporichthyaceae bacterium]